MSRKRYRHYATALGTPTVYRRLVPSSISHLAELRPDLRVGRVTGHVDSFCRSVLPRWQGPFKL